MHTFTRDASVLRIIRARRQIAVTALAAFLLASCASMPAPDFPANEEALTDTLREAAENAERTYKFEAAASHYSRLAERQPDSIDPILGQARNLRYAGAPGDAIRILRRAIETRGEQSPLLLELAKAQFASTFIADARDTLAKLVELTPDDWRVYNILAMIEDNKGQFVEAQELYRKALALSPNNTSVINNYSLSLAQAGELDQAIRALEPIVYGERSTIQTRQNLAMLYVFNGDKESAEKLLEGDLPPDLARQNLGALQELAE